MSIGRILVLVAAGLLALAWILYVVGNALPKWVSDSTGSATAGLWQYCAGGTCQNVGDVCSANEGSCSKLQAARAFMTLVCIISPFAVGCLIFVGITNKFDLPFIWIGRGLAGVSFLFGLIGMAIGISYVTQALTPTLGPAAIVSIIAVIVNLAAVVIAALSRAK